jgi:hypothetical protein
MWMKSQTNQESARLPACHQHLEVAEGLVNLQTAVDNGAVKRGSDACGRAPCVALASVEGQFDDADEPEWDDQGDCGQFSDAESTEAVQRRNAPELKPLLACLLRKNMQSAIPSLNVNTHGHAMPALPQTREAWTQQPLLGAQYAVSWNAQRSALRCTVPVVQTDAMMRGLSAQQQQQRQQHYQHQYHQQNQYHQQIGVVSRPLAFAPLLPKTSLPTTQSSSPPSSSHQLQHMQHHPLVASPSRLHSPVRPVQLAKLQHPSAFIIPGQQSQQYWSTVGITDVPSDLQSRRQPIQASDIQPTDILVRLLLHVHVHKCISVNRFVCLTSTACFCVWSYVETSLLIAQLMRLTLVSSHCAHFPLFCSVCTAVLSTLSCICSRDAVAFPTTIQATKPGVSSSMLTARNTINCPSLTSKSSLAILSCTCAHTTKLDFCVREDTMCGTSAETWLQSKSARKPCERLRDVASLSRVKTKRRAAQQPREELCLSLRRSRRWRNKRLSWYL